MLISIWNGCLGPTKWWEDESSGGRPNQYNCADRESNRRHPDYGLDAISTRPCFHFLLLDINNYIPNFVHAYSPTIFLWKLWNPDWLLICLLFFKLKALLYYSIIDVLNKKYCEIKTHFNQSLVFSIVTAIYLLHVSGQG